MNNQLRRQIQEEIDQEAMVERRINNSIKRFFKMFKQYKEVTTIDQSDVVLMFDKSDIKYFNVFMTDENVKNYFKTNINPNHVFVYIKSKNKHDAKTMVVSNILTRMFYKH